MFGVLVPELERHNFRQSEEVLGMENEVKPYPLITSAIRQGDLNELKRLFEDFPDFKGLDVPGFGNWLIYASAMGNGDIVRYLISSGFDVNATDKRNEQSPLEAACSKGRVEIVDILLSEGAVLDTSSASLNPLFSAVVGRSVPVAERLLGGGIDAEKRYILGGENNPSLDAVAFAMMHGQREIAHLIALQNSDGDEIVAQAEMAEGLKIAERVTVKPIE